MRTSRTRRQPAAGPTVGIKDIARALGVSHGDPVVVRGESGAEVRARAHLAPIREGNVQMFWPEANALIGASPEARGPIAETAENWARLIAASPQTCNDYTAQNVCELMCQRVAGTPIPDCRPITLEWAFTFLTATVQATARSGDRAAATLSNDVIVQLRRSATGEWLIDGMGPFGAVGPDAAAQRREHPGP